jgi:hypothetical protein
MLDGLLAGTSNGAWWDGFFADESRRPPFLVDWPDENLAAWFGDRLLIPGRVLELGCGNGRNAVYLASLGCRSASLPEEATCTGTTSAAAPGCSPTATRQRFQPATPSPRGRTSPARNGSRPVTRPGLVSVRPRILWGLA